MYFLYFFIFKYFSEGNSGVRRISRAQVRYMKQKHEKRTEGCNALCALVLMFPVPNTFPNFKLHRFDIVNPKFSVILTGSLAGVAISNA